MPAPGEYKTVRARILAYAQEIGWTFVPRDEAELRRGVRPHNGLFLKTGRGKWRVRFVLLGKCHKRLNENLDSNE